MGLAIYMGRVHYVPISQRNGEAMDANGAPILDVFDVQTMRQVRARAEFLAWSTRDAYRDAARNAVAPPPGWRVAMEHEAWKYKRRAIRLSNYCNRRAS